MEIDKRKFIFKKPVHMDFGTINFLTVDDYMDVENDLAMIAMNSLHFFYAYKKAMNITDETQLDELRKLKETPLYHIVFSDESILTSYFKVFEMVIDYTEGFDFKYIAEDEDRFMTVRKIVMDMNLVKEDKVYANERLQKGEDMKKMVEKTMNKDSQTIEDIVTSIVASSNHSYDEINKMTIYQLHSTFARVNAIIEYQTAILFRTVSNDYPLEHWAKHIDLLEESQTKDMNRTEFEQKFGEILS